jgi:hypothetical protein
MPFIDNPEHVRFILREGGYSQEHQNTLFINNAKRVDLVVNELKQKGHIERLKIFFIDWFNDVRYFPFTPSGFLGKWREPLKVECEQSKIKLLNAIKNNTEIRELILEMNFDMKGMQILADKIKQQKSNLQIFDCKNHKMFEDRKMLETFVDALSKSTTIRKLVIHNICSVDDFVFAPGDEHLFTTNPFEHVKLLFSFLKYNKSVVNIHFKEGTWKWSPPDSDLNHQQQQEILIQQ